MKIRPGFEGLCYVGADPSTGVGVVRLALGQMTEKQMRGWMQIDPSRASLYIDTEGKDVEPAPIPVIDNNAGAPLPQIPTNEPTNAKAKSGYFKKTLGK